MPKKEIVISVPLSSITSIEKRVRSVPFYDLIYFFSPLNVTLALNLISVDAGESDSIYSKSFSSSMLAWRIAEF